MQALNFLKHFITSPREVGAVLPSSRFLADRVVEEAKVRHASVVVEWGPGTGAITRAVLDKLPHDATFFAMEITPAFVEAMHIRFPQVDVHLDSAENTRKYLELRELHSCDCVVSGLPWTTFPDALQDSLLDTLVDVLRPGGLFVTYTYVMSPLMSGGKKFKQKVLDRFSRVDCSPFVLINVPPAFVYVAEK
ncbi:MAG: methyltransferase domain-containing protein [FCB group bacterium]|nr:methyltransferase domain-containing protein [FCB group bacterium]